MGSPNLDYTQPPVDAVMPATPQLVGNAIHSPVGQDNDVHHQRPSDPWHFVLAYPWYVAVTAVEQIPAPDRHDAHLDVGGQHRIGAGSAIVVYKLFPRLTGWRQLWVLGVVPSFAMAAHRGCGPADLQRARRQD